MAADVGRRFLAGVLQLYCLVYRRLLLTPPMQRPLPLEAFTLQRWLWAGAILSSRQTEIDDKGLTLAIDQNKLARAVAGFPLAGYLRVDDVVG